jgi:hypothetical protein
VTLPVYFRSPFRSQSFINRKQQKKGEEQQTRKQTASSPFRFILDSIFGRTNGRTSVHAPGARAQFKFNFLPAVNAIKRTVFFFSFFFT